MLKELTGWTRLLTETDLQSDCPQIVNFLQTSSQTFKFQTTQGTVRRTEKTVRPEVGQQIKEKKQFLIKNPLH